MRSLSSLFLLFMSICSVVFGSDFQKNTELINALTQNNVRLIVLCNYQGTNNVLDIVTSSHSPGYELTIKGLRDLNNAIPALSILNISHIYTAPAFRTQQTTNLIGKAFQLPPNHLHVDSRLKMQNFGDAEGIDYDLYKQLFSGLEDMLEGTPNNGESGLSVFNRVQDFLFSLTGLQNQTVLIVTHAFNYCHIAKCLKGKFGDVPSPGKRAVYDFNNPVIK